MTAGWNEGLTKALAIVFALVVALGWSHALALTPSAATSEPFSVGASAPAASCNCPTSCPCPETPGSAIPQPLQIVAVTNARDGSATVALGDSLNVKLGLTVAPSALPKPTDQAKPVGNLDPAEFVLYLNDTEIDGLDDTTYDAASSTLTFHLQRNDKNAAAWKAVLRAPPGLTVPVAIALDERMVGNSPPKPTIAAAKPNAATIALAVTSTMQLWFAAVAILTMLIVLWGSATRSAILKDNLIPQIDPRRQTYSLARWQMAFWFTLIFASYVVLYIVLGDINTLSDQALMLMGISGTTALAAVAVDVAKDTPDDAVNAALRLLGINNYQDVIRIDAEIADRQAELTATPAPSPARTVQLNGEIIDRQLRLRTYAEKTKGYVSEGWYRDLVTDINGPSLHRVQSLCWTLLLGCVFVVEVWQNLVIPPFSSTLLAVMGISSAGYVGFKYQEIQQ